MMESGWSLLCDGKKVGGVYCGIFLIKFTTRIAVDGDHRFH